MEIAVLQKNGLKLRGKQAALLINVIDKTVAHDAVIALGDSYDRTLKNKSDVVVIDGPGDYEVGGVKITGSRADGNTVYSLTIDGVEMLLGALEDLEKMHQKLKEHHIVVASVGSVIDASFMTTLASNVVLFFGDKAGDVTGSFAKDSLKTMPKYQVTKEKLPQEMETVLLQ